MTGASRNIKQTNTLFYLTLHILRSLTLKSSSIVPYFMIFWRLNVPPTTIINQSGNSLVSSNMLVTVVMICYIKNMKTVITLYVQNELTNTLIYKLSRNHQKSGLFRTNRNTGLYSERNDIKLDRWASHEFPEQNKDSLMYPYIQKNYVPNQF